MADNYANAADVDDEATSAVALTTDSLTGQIQGLRDGSSIYTSLSLATLKDKLAALKAVTDAKKIRDDKGKITTGVIALTDFIVQPVEIADRATGEVQLAPRVILIGEDGASYAVVSRGILSSLELLIGVAGQPATWGEPIPVTVSEEMTRAGFRVLTLNYA